MQQRGQSLIEIMVGVAIGAIFIIGAGVIMAPSIQINKQTSLVQTKTELGLELLGNVKSWSNANWNNVLALATGTANGYFLSASTSPFTVANGGAPGIETIVQSTNGITITYSRYFYLSDVYRDLNGSVTSTMSGNNYDPSTKFVTVVVTASTSLPTPAVSISYYLTRNIANSVTQGSWSGGGGQNNPLTITSSTFATSSNISVSASGTLQLQSGSSSICTQ